MTGGESPVHPVKQAQWSSLGPAVERTTSAIPAPALPAPLSPQIAVYFSHSDLISMQSRLYSVLVSKDIP